MQNTDATNQNTQINSTPVVMNATPIVNTESKMSGIFTVLIPFFIVILLGTGLVSGYLIYRKMALLSTAETNKKVVVQPTIVPTAVPEATPTPVASNSAAVKPQIFEVSSPESINVGTDGAALSDLQNDLLGL